MNGIPVGTVGIVVAILSKRYNQWFIVGEPVTWTGHNWVNEQGFITSGGEKQIKIIMFNSLSQEEKTMYLMLYPFLSKGDL